LLGRARRRITLIDEPRLMVIGFSDDGRLLVVITSQGGRRLPIISAWRATKRERREYEER
jgi:uncharacterized DUF497 family protein